MAEVKFQMQRKNADGTLDTYHPETVTDMVLDENGVPLSAGLGGVTAAVGTNADAASANGSVHAKLKELRAYVDTRCAAIETSINPKFLGVVKCITPSNDVKLSADTERSVTKVSGGSGGWDYPVTVKHIILPFQGTIRLSAQFKTDYSISSNYGMKNIKKSGVAIEGVDNTVKQTEWTTLTIDVPVVPGDYITIALAHTLNGRSTFVRNFRIMGLFCEAVITN